MKMIKKLLYLACILMVSFSSKGQNTDLAGIEFTYFPQSNSDNSFRRFKGHLNFPISLGKEGSYLIPGIEYENVNFKFLDYTPFQKKGELDRFQSITASLGYTFEMKKDWRFAAWAGILAASNFETGKIIRDDLLFTGAVGFIRDQDEEQADEPWRLILGIYYSTKSGRPFPLPIVNYYREFHPDWSYTVGVPKSNLKYYLSEKSEFQAFVTLDGFYANIQEDRLFNTSDKIAESISMTIVLAGLGYEYNFTEHLVYYIYGGHTIMNDIRLKNANKDDIYTINDTNSFYGRTGLKFVIF